jgi:hypothetical protein
MADPHVTPMVSVWSDGALYFSTGRSERKAHNLAGNAKCIITTGCNALAHGLDLVVEGDAALVTDKPTIQNIADAFAAKYRPPFNFGAHDFADYGEGGDILLYQVVPKKAFGYGRGALFSATRWRFSV